MIYSDILTEKSNTSSNKSEIEERITDWRNNLVVTQPLRKSVTVLHNLDRLGMSHLSHAKNDEVYQRNPPIKSFEVSPGKSYVFVYHSVKYEIYYCDTFWHIKKNEIERRETFVTLKIAISFVKNYLSVLP